MDMNIHDVTEVIIKKKGVLNVRGESFAVQDFIFRTARGERLLVTCYGISAGTEEEAKKSIKTIRMK